MDKIDELIYSQRDKTTAGHSYKASEDKSLWPRPRSMQPPKFEIPEESKDFSFLKEDEESESTYKGPEF